MIALYSSVAARRFSEQDLELLVSLASAGALRVRNIALVEQEAERRVVDRELALARDIQMGMLRRQPLGRSDVDVAARQVPARQVGGDFYEYLVDGDRLWFIVADVAGKGMAAALMMAMSQTLFRAIAGLRLPLDEVVARLNREVARDNERGMFVTALAGCLDLPTGRLDLANAGHNLPYLLRRNGAVDVVAARNALALGVMENVAFPVTELVLEPGDGLFLYTDGVCDAVNTLGAAFGTAGIERLLPAVAGGAARFHRRTRVPGRRDLCGKRRAGGRHHRGRDPLSARSLTNPSARLIFRVASLVPFSARVKGRERSDGA